MFSTERQMLYNINGVVPLHLGMVFSQAFIVFPPEMV